MARVDSRVGRYGVYHISPYAYEWTKRELTLDCLTLWEDLRPEFGSQGQEGAYHGKRLRTASGITDRR